MKIWIALALAGILAIGIVGCAKPEGDSMAPATAPAETSTTDTGLPATDDAAAPATDDAAAPATDGEAPATEDAASNSGN